MISTSKTKKKEAESLDKMQLCVWGGGWGLPSIDVESLQIMTYVKFSRAPVTISQCENPWKSPKGTIPFFQHESKLIYSHSEIYAYLRQKNHTCDFGLSPKQSAEVIAYTQLVTETLSPALKYFYWIENNNYVSLMRPCYTRRLPWIYKFWYPDRRLKSEAQELVDAYHNSPLGESMEPEILQKARACITVLSDKLGDNEFFLHSNYPCALDAVIFPYLAIFLKVPLPHSPIKELIHLTPNLERFVARVLHRCYANIRSPLGEVITSSSVFGTDGHPTTVKSDENLFPTHQKLIAVAFGLILMLAFAYKNGMIQIGFDGTPMEEDDIDDDKDIWE